MNEIILRKVNIKDIDLLFEWTNELAVRENSFCSKLILYAEHVAWFQECLLDSDVDMYIAELEGVPAGTIRMNCSNDIAVISFSVDKNYRGQGIGKKMLQLAEESIFEKRKDIHCLTGKTKVCNIASQKAFLSNGYKCVKKEQYYEFKKNVKALRP